MTLCLCLCGEKEGKINSAFWLIKESQEVQSLLDSLMIHYEIILHGGFHLL